MLQSLIQRFRADEDAGRAVLILDDEQAKALCVAWQSLPVQWRDPGREQPESEIGLWRWMWDGAIFDESELSAASNLPLSVAVAKFRQLRDARLLYPDGTVAGWVSKILAAEVVSYVKRLTGTRESKDRA